MSIGERARAVTRRRVARSRMVEPLPAARRGRLGLDRHQPRRRRRADGVPHPRRATARRCGPAALIAMRQGVTRVFAPRRRRVSSPSALAIAAHRHRVSRCRCAFAPATSTIDAGAALPRPGARRARRRRHRVLGRRRARDDRRTHRGARLSRAHRLRRTAEIGVRYDFRVPTLCVDAVGSRKSCLIPISAIAISENGVRTRDQTPISASRSGTRNVSRPKWVSDPLSDGPRRTRPGCRARAAARASTARRSPPRA